MWCSTWGGATDKSVSVARRTECFGVFLKEKRERDGERESERWIFFYFATASTDRSASTCKFRPAGLREERNDTRAVDMVSFLERKTTRVAVKCCKVNITYYKKKKICNNLNFLDNIDVFI